MKRTIKVLSLIIALVLCLSNMVYTSAETQNLPIEGVWNLIDIEVAYHQHGFTITLKKRSIIERKDISVSFKGDRCTLRIKEENNSETYFGTYQIGESNNILNVQAEDEQQFNYYLIGNALVLIQDNETYTFLREGSSKEDAYKGGTVEGKWALTNIETIDGFEEMDDEKETKDLLVDGIVFLALLGGTYGERQILFDLDNNTLTIQATLFNNEEPSEFTGTYWTANTMIHLSMNDSDEALCYTVEGDTLKIGTNLYWLTFIRQ